MENSWIESLALQQLSEFILFCWTTVNDDDPAAALAHLHSDAPTMMPPLGDGINGTLESCYSCLVMFPILCVNCNTHKFEV